MGKITTLEEKEIKGKNGDVIAIQKVQVDEDKLKEEFSEVGAVDKAARDAKLAEWGYKTAQISKINSELSF